MTLSCIDSEKIIDVKIRDDPLDLIGNSTCEGVTQDFYTAIQVSDVYYKIIFAI